MTILPSRVKAINLAQCFYFLKLEKYITVLPGVKNQICKNCSERLRIKILSGPTFSEPRATRELHTPGLSFFYTTILPGVKKSNLEQYFLE
jgi:hypothetical protein